MKQASINIRKGLVFRDVIDVCGQRKLFIDDDVIRNIAEKSDFVGSDKKLLQKLLTSEKSVFATSKFDFGSYDTEEVSFDVNDCATIYVKPKRIPYSIRDILTKTTNKLCQKGIIRESKGSN